MRTSHRFNGSLRRCRQIPLITLSNNLYQIAFFSFKLKSYISTVTSIYNLRLHKNRVGNIVTMLKIPKEYKLFLFLAIIEINAFVTSLHLYALWSVQM